jgi:leucyl-tRNA synthetase
MRKTLTVSSTEPASREDAASRWKPSAERAEQLRDRARAERRTLSHAEAALWARLSGAQLGGVKFTRKEVVGSVIADFACSARWLVVSVTAEGVNPEVGALQDRKLIEAGIRVLRFAEADVVQDLDGVVKTIAHLLNEPFERPAPARPARAPQGRPDRAPRRQG